jgi:hypothetical protein
LNWKIELLNGDCTKQKRLKNWIYSMKVDMGSRVFQG